MSDVTRNYYDRVVVGLTTVPNRVGNLGAVLDSIDRQTRKATEVVVCVPEFSQREQKEYPTGQIRKIASSHGASIRVISEDYGPLTKLMGLLLTEPPAAGTLLITVDDDNVLHPDTVETLVAEAERHPYEVVAIDCVRVDAVGMPKFGTSVWLRNNMATGWASLSAGDQANVVMGCGGVAYPRLAFGSNLPDPEMEALRKGSASIPGLHYSDDLYISAWLCSMGVKKRCASFKDVSARHSAMPGSRENALCSDGKPNYSALTAASHTLRWFRIVRELQQRGLLERVGDMEGTRFGKDLVVIAAAALVLSSLCALAYRRCHCK